MLKLLLARIKAHFRYLLVCVRFGRRIAQRDPNSNPGECAALVTQYVLSNPDPTIEGAIAVCAADHRTIDAATVLAQFQGLALAVPSLRPKLPMCGPFRDEPVRVLAKVERPQTTSQRDFSKPRPLPAGTRERVEN